MSNGIFRKKAKDFERGEKAMKKTNHLLSIFLSFLKIGLFSFGGGISMIPLMEREFIDKRKWIDHDDFLNLVIIAESTPGPIAINAATYIGYKVSRFIGALTATVAICIPSFAIIYTVSLFFNAFLENRIIANAFSGIQACVIYLILSAGIKMFKKMKRTPLSIVLAVFTFIVMIAVSLFAFRFSSIFFILIGAAVGIVAYVISLCRHKSKTEEKGEV